MQTQYEPMSPALLAAFSQNLSLVHFLLERDPTQMGARDVSGTNLLYMKIQMECTPFITFAEPVIRSMLN